MDSAPCATQRCSALFARLFGLSLGSHVSTCTDSTAAVLVFSQPLRPLPSVAFEAKRPEIVQHAFAAFENWRDVIHFEPSTLIRGFPA